MTDINKLEKLRRELISNIKNLNSNLKKTESEIFKDKINKIFINFPIVESITWWQFNDYNDSYYEFDLHEFEINGFTIKDFYGVTDDKWNYFDLDNAIPYNDDLVDFGQKDLDFDEVERNIREKFKDLIPAIRFIIIEFKYLHDNLGSNFFKFYFGIRVKVKITKEQIIIEDYE